MLGFLAISLVFKVLFCQIYVLKHVFLFYHLESDPEPIVLIVVCQVGEEVETTFDHRLGAPKWRP